MDPVVVDDLIFLSSAYYKTGSVLLRVKPDDRGVEVVWRGTELELHWMTPVCAEGFLYGFSGRNEWDTAIPLRGFAHGQDSVGPGPRLAALQHPRGHRSMGAVR